MKTILILPLIIIAGCSTAPKRSAQENLSGLLSALHTSGLSGAKTYFEQHKQFIPYPYEKEMLLVGQREGMSGEYQKYVTLKDIKRKSKSHSRMIQNAQRSCASKKIHDLKSCSDSFKDQPLLALLNGFWITQQEIDTAIPIISGGISQYEVELKESKTKTQALKGEATQKLKKQRDLCRSKNIKHMVDITARIKENIGGGLLNAKLIATNRYLCGKPAEIVRRLPKIFVLGGIKNPKPQTCATIIVRSSGEKTLPDKQGFNQKWTLWKPALKSHIVSGSYQPEWRFCP